MKTIRCDFRPPSIPSTVLWLACAGLVVATAVSSYTAWQETQNTAALEVAYSAALSQSRRPPDGANPSMSAAKPYERGARQMLLERTLPWPQALTALEANAMVGVTPRSIEASAGDRSMRVEVAATSHSKVLEFVEALNAGNDGSPAELQWSVQRSQVDNVGGTTLALIMAKRAGTP